MQFIINYILVIIFVIISGFFYLKKYKIPNYITYPAIVIGIVINFIFNFSWFYFVVLFCGFIFFIILASITKLISAGDLKMILGIFAVCPIYQGLFTRYLIIDSLIIGMFISLFATIFSILLDSSKRDLIDKLMSNKLLLIPFGFYLCIGVLYCLSYSII